MVLEIDQFPYGYPRMVARLVRKGDRIARRIERSQFIRHRSGGESLPGLPDPVNPVQWAMDGEGYRNGLLDGISVLESKESYDTYRAPVVDISPVFDGSAKFDYSSRITGSGSLTSLTVGCWFKTTQNEVDFRTIFGEASPITDDIGWAVILLDGSIGLIVSSAGSFFSSRVVLTDATFVDGNWHHVTCTYNAGTVLIYIDGLLSPSTLTGVPALSINDHSSDFTIGDSSDGGLGNGSFGGYVGSLQAVTVNPNAVFTATEVLELASNNGAPNLSGIVPGQLTGGNRSVGGVFWLQENNLSFAINAVGNFETAIGSSVTLETDSPVVNRCNTRGYSLPSSMRIPRLENGTNVETDSFGQPLEFVGQCPYPVSVQVPCVDLSDPAYLGSASATTNGAEELLDRVNDYTIVMRIIMASWPTTGNKACFLSSRRTGDDGRTAIGIDEASDTIGVYTKTATNLTAGESFTNAKALLDDGNEHTIFLIHDANASSTEAAKLYIDGVRADSATNGSATAYQDWGMAVGATNSGSFDADIVLSHFAIYGLLTVAEAQASDKIWIFNNPDLYWVFGGKGDTVYDVSGNGYHQTFAQGVLSIIWAATSDIEKDYFVFYGGYFDANGDAVSIPALLDGSLAANGSSLNILPLHINPLALIEPNPFGAAELAIVTASSPYASSVDVAAVDVPGSKSVRTGDNLERDRWITHNPADYA